MLRGIELDVPRGSTTVIIGGSGSGKSVLMKHMLGLLKPDSGQVIIDGEDVTWALRTAVVDANVSAVSAYPAVRTALTRQQRRIAAQGRVVMVGRDIGTVVVPEAPLKIYLDASPEERAHRRWLELQQRGQDADPEAILTAMRARDAYDSTRKTAPLRAASDAIIIDTDGMSGGQVVDEVMRLAERFEG